MVRRGPRRASPARRGRSGRVEERLPQSWVPTQKYDVIELQSEVVTGRRFLLQRPGAGHEDPATD